MTLPVRFSLSIPLAAAITLALFAIMQALVVVDRVVIDKTPGVTIDWVRHLELEPLVPHRRRIEKVPPPEIPPVIPPISMVSDGPGPIVVSGPLPVPGNDVVIGPVSDGPVLPSVRIEPVYPRSALSRGVEGYVIVEFDVWTDGSVRNARVIEHYPSEIFDQTSLNAISRFRYKPKIENGKPVIVTGMQNRFTFELTKPGY